MIGAACTPIRRCRICGNGELINVLSLGNLALTGVFPAQATDEVPSGPLELVRCAQGCGLVQLAHTYDGSALYGSGYGYRSGLNPAMVAHLLSLARALLVWRRTSGRREREVIVDIGSNDGTLLGHFADLYHKCIGGEPPMLVGIDPTGEKFARYYRHGMILVPDFFSPKAFARASDEKATLVTSVAMFYDLEDPCAFVEGIRDILHDEGLWLFEQSYLPTMLHHLAYDTVCHEHVEYYGLRQVKWMLDRAGMKIVHVELTDTNGGSFFVVAAKRDAWWTPSDRLHQLLAAEEPLQRAETFRDFAARVQRHRKFLQDFVEATWKLGRGPVLGYGASTKGNVLLQYCGFTADDIPFVAERNPDKYGRYTPDSKIPIIAESEARALGPRCFVVLPWHFRGGIIERERAFLRDGGALVFPLPEFTVVEGLS